MLKSKAQRLRCRKCTRHRQKYVLFIPHTVSRCGCPALKLVCTFCFPSIVRHLPPGASVSPSRPLIDMLSPLPVTAQAICIRQKALFLCLALLILVYFSISTRIRRLDYLTPNDLVRNTTIARVSERPGGSRHRILPCDVFSAAPTSLEELEAPTNAYITYFHLDAVGSDQDADIDPERNNLYLAARLLTYQLLHAPETKSKTGYPLIVMVSDAVPETMRDRLRKDGAIIYPVETIQPDWIVQNTQHSYATVATKFHAWRLTQFSRLLFLDLDTVLARSLDGVFESAASAPRMTRRLGLNDTSGASLFNHTMPSDYVLAANMELNEKEEHTYPPTDESASFQGPDYPNSGFFLIKPSMQLFDM